MNDARQSESRAAMRWEDWVGYGLIIAGIYFLVGVLFFYAGKEKLFDGLGAPPPIEKQFEGTFLNVIPGIDAAWTILGILEFAIFVLMVVSIITLEFLPGKRKPFMVSGLALAIFTFSILGIGQNVVGETGGVAELFLYAGATGILIALALNLPPYRASNWLSGRGVRSS
jgi:hypothetical protein